MVKPRQQQLEDLSGDVSGNGSSIATVSLTGSAGIVDCNSTRFENCTGSVTDESATVPGGAPGAGKGVFWVRDDSPTAPIFTNSVGTDIELGGGGGGGVVGLPWVVFRPGVAISGNNVFDDFELMFDFLDTTQGPQRIYLDLTNSILPFPNAFSVPARSVGSYDFREEIELVAPHAYGVEQGLLFQQQILNLRRISGPFFLISDINAPGDALLELGAAPTQFIIGAFSNLTQLAGKTPAIEIVAGSNPSILLEEGSQIEGNVGEPCINLPTVGTAVDINLLANAKIRSNTLGSIAGSSIDVYRVGSAADIDSTQPDNLGTYSITNVPDSRNINVVFSAGNYSPTSSDVEGNLRGIDSKFASGVPDGNAVHVNTAGEISAIALKATPIGADLLLIEDSADSNNKKRALVSSISDTNAIHVNVASEISAITLKATPIGADILLIEDSADSNNKKRALVSSISVGGPVDSWSAVVRTRAELVAALNVTVSGSEIRVGFTGTTRIEIAGTITLGAGEFIRVYDGSNIVGTSKSTVSPSNVGGAQIDGNINGASILRYDAHNGIELRNIRVNNSDTAFISSALLLKDSFLTGNTIVDNCIFSGSRGVTVDNCQQGLISRCVLLGGTANGTTSGGVVFDGASPSENFRIVDCQLRHNDSGVNINDSSGVIVQGGVSSRAGSGATLNGVGIHFPVAYIGSGVQIEGVKFTTPSAAVGNRGITTAAFLAVNSVRVINCTSTLGTGSIFMELGGVTNCEFIGNRCDGNFWRNNGGSSSQSIIANNHTSAGYILQEAGSDSNNCSFIGNRSDFGTIGMFDYPSTAGANLGNSYIGNHARNGAGILSCVTGSGMDQCTFANNVSVFSASKMFTIIASGNVSNSTFTGNVSANGQFSDIAFTLANYITSVARGNVAGLAGPIADF